MIEAATGSRTIILLIPGLASPSTLKGFMIAYLCNYHIHPSLDQQGMKGKIRGSDMDIGINK